jgi:hypothetical protein
VLDAFKAGAARGEGTARFCPYYISIALLGQKIGPPTKAVRLCIFDNAVRTRKKLKLSRVDPSGTQHILKHVAG